MVETENIVNSMLINGITPDSLRQLIRAAIRAELDDFVKQVREQPDPLIRRVEAAKRLGVSTVTLDKYLKYGLLHGKHVGGRIYIAESEINAFLFNNSKKSKL